MPPRRGVVDLGSNSVRLVIFEGLGRNPQPIFNERAVLRLGRGLQTTGRLNEAGVAAALGVMQRFHAVAKAMHADPLEVLATAAVRDASNGPAFVADLNQRMPGVPIRILSGQEEASLSAAGLLCGIPEADGILADIGGGSLEVVQLTGGKLGAARTLPLGVIRLADRSEGDLERARTLVEADLATVNWLPETPGRDLYLVGGAWRALARIQMAQTGYPLPIVHHYTIDRDAARDLAATLATSPRRMLEKLPGAHRRRIDDLPYAAVVLRRLLRVTGARRVVFSANGIREGWFMAGVPPAVAAEEPVLAASRELGARETRDLALPDALFTWTAPLFPHENAAAAILRQAACALSDIGNHEHPEFRAEQSFNRVLRQPGIALDHHGRAFLAAVTAARYDADPGAAFVQPAQRLLDPAAFTRAQILGQALRIGYIVSAGTATLLAGTALAFEAGRLRLLVPDDLVLTADSIPRRMERLSATLGLALPMAPVPA